MRTSIEYPRRSFPALVAGLALVVAAVGSACAPPAPVAVPAPDAAVRQQQPAPLAPRPLEFPPFRELRLENGLRVIVVEHPGQPLANVNLYVRSGGAAESAELAGLAGMVAELVTKGTATRSASEIAETIEGVGGQLNSSAGNDWLTISASVLSDHLPLAFELVGDVALRPTFPDEEVTVTRRRTLSGLQAQLGQPGAIAQRQFLRDIYGPHPYGISAIPGTVQAITRDDLVRFHADHFAADNALLVVSGVVDAGAVESLARRHFGDWRQGAAARPALPQPPVLEATRIALVHRPGSVQSNIRIGHLAIRPDNPDYFPLTVLNNIVGGGTDARLFQILREERGWTYGAYSQLTRPVDIGYFMANAEVRTEVTDSALVEMLSQLNRIRDERVPAEEFEGAKSFLAGSFPLRIETAGQIAGQIAQARLLGLPMEYVSEFPQRIMAVTAEDVQRVARQYVRPDRAAVVVVGDAREVLPMIEGIAPVTLYDVEGAPLGRDALEVRAAAERYDGSRLQAGRRAYRFLIQDNPMGTVTEVLARDGDVWVATSTTEAAGMSQESETRFAVADLSAISSIIRIRQAGAAMEGDLRVADGRIMGRLELPEPMGGARDVDAAMPEGTLLPGMDAHVLAAADLAEGRSVTLPVFDMMSGAVTSITFQVTGVEEVTVPAGTFSTYRIAMTGGAQPMTLYVRRDAPHIMVRQEFTGAPVAIELESLD
jgi:zinc protease